ncbi:MAG: glutathione S-transferase C-terminal domain-containing protein [Pseudomonadales bacterium]|nr:glutathione S-transferase C-terminal domain-containing protein [Pseudomonadales bacterium]MDG1441880.1 glutathione S-transferase C-terminal domain-containing protein [Pseudomonadales bacterium]
MGMLVDGQWQDQEVRRTNAEGAFVRNESPYRDVIGSERFPVEADRYHLFVNAGCPWAYRTILYRSIKNLQPYLTMSYTLPAAGQQGWTFGEAGEPLLNAMHMHDVYTQANDDFTGRCTVPVLWDKNSHTIVNNESADIIRMFDSAFDDQQGVSPTRYYLTEHATEIDALNDEIYTTINNGVYRCGFSQSQAAYDEAFDLLFASLDQLDKRLAGQRYLCGAPITEADWRLFATLVRFDFAYYGQFKCNLHRIVDYPNLWPYMRDLYQQPGVAETVDITAIKGIYYGSRAPGILPKGPALDFAEPHGRASL